MWKIAIVSSAIFAQLVQLTVLADVTYLTKPEVINPSVGVAVKSFLIAIAQFAVGVVNAQRITVAFVNG